jgi:hypothetical protein
MKTVKEIMQRAVEINVLEEKLKVFAKVLEKEQIERLQKDGLGYQSNIDSVKVQIIEGKKYVKVNIGNSGKYMIDWDGNIFGIKAYGVINKKKCYGTLDTINEWYWGDYTARPMAMKKLEEKILLEG